MEVIGTILTVAISGLLALWIYENDKVVGRHRLARDAERPLGMGDKEWARRRENARRNERRKAQRRRRP